MVMTMCLHIRVIILEQGILDRDGRGDAEALGRIHHLVNIFLRGGLSHLEIVWILSPLVITGVMKVELIDPYMFIVDLYMSCY